jgi:hypothetical protein
MSETITVPRHASYRARMKLERAEAVVNAFCGFFVDVAALFARIPPAKDEQALSIRRAWLRASA